MTFGKRFFIILLLAFSFSGLMAQNNQKAAKKQIKKQLAEAKTNIKNGSNLENVEKSMRTLLQDSANIENEKIWLTLFEAIKKQHEQLNEKLYLKQESDTAKFFTHTLSFFSVLESMDSIDAKPDSDGVSRPKYRKEHASILVKHRKNLYGGGGYYLGKEDYANAYQFFDSYIDCRNQPLFTGYSFDEKKIVNAAYWAVFCGYKLGQCDFVEKYAETAMRDPANEMYVLQYMAESYALKEDTASYHRVLRAGFDKYTDNPYFFQHLAMYYSRDNRYEEIADIAEKMLAIEPENVAALVAKSSVLFHKEEYAECVKVCDEAIDLDPGQTIPYINAGLAYYNRTVAINEKNNKTKDERQELLDLYKRALPYLEKYRQMAPDAKDMWGVPLYNIYFNLNMGNEFEEIEELLH